MADSIEKLKDIFKKFPTVGHRTAGRFVYYLAKLPKEKVAELILAITDLKNKIKLCRLCFNPYEGESEICPICQDSRRDKKILCIVEKEADLITIENTKKYNGLYFILGGTVAMMRKEDVSQLRLDELKNRIKNNGFLEIIIAINPTPEGIATSVLVESIIKETGSSAKITHLARGIPIGGELEYADEETLASAFEGRK
ncbi:MAG: recombination mediator RecR [Candidatus Staskawiczbacteria bacterium]|nr:recombination mediator RecR [Candidatus Staskawiczbacteria bacterium]